MRILSKFLLLVLSVTCGALGQQNVWVSAYYAGWNSSILPPNQIDYGALTHLIHFSIYPTGGASFDGTLNGLTPSHMTETVQAAHAARKKAILGVGGWGADFRQAYSSQNRSASVHNLMTYIRTYGYDGIDIDEEPVLEPQNFAPWIAMLRDSLKAHNPNSVLTVAAFSYDQAVVDNRQYFDQINLMTYDMSGPWPGWVTWHNSPVYDGGYRFPSTNGLVPSANGSIDEYIAAGVPRAKLGIGMDFLGYVWWGGSGTPTGGVTAPRQEWSSPPDVRSNVTYSELMDTYSGYPVLWDSAAQACYISIDQAGSSNDKFISFDNEQTAIAKAEYIRTKGIGGLIVFELGSGYRSNLPAGQRDFLLQAVKYAFFGGNPPVQDSIPPSVTITAPLAGASLSGTVTLTATATDNAAVFGVQFKIDGANVGNEDPSPPYSASLNTWKYANGQHRITATARDASGNTATASVDITINNQGPPPVIPDMVVYDDALRSPFTNTSWGATVSFNNTTNVKSGTRSARVNYGDWGAFDLLSGDWNLEQPIDPAEYDSLVFDVYPTSSFTLDIAFYNNYQVSAQLAANQWSRVAVPLEFEEPFTRFYMRRDLSGSATAYFDNIKFVGSTYGQTGYPAGSLSASPDTLPSGGGTVSLSWSSSNATSARIDPGVGPVSLNGTTQVSVTSTTTFTLTLDNDLGSQSYTASVVVRPPSSQGPQDITAQASIVALVMNPTGSGNPDIGVIRDGNTPPVGSTNPLDQFDTFNGGGTRPFDWIGYEFTSAFNFSSVVYQEGLDSQSGGCFDALGVQVRSNGIWTDVQNLVTVPRYPGSNNTSFETFEIQFDPIPGDAIRIAGPPSGTADYISVAELRVFGDPTPGEIPFGSFDAIPDSLPSSGGDVKLVWTSTGAQTASIDPDIGNVPVNGNISVPIHASTDFLLTLANSHGSIQRHQSVILSPSVPSGSLSATPDSLSRGGGNVVLSWTSTNATSAEIAPQVGSVGLSGSIAVRVKTSRTFTLTLSNAQSSVSYDASVTVEKGGGRGKKDRTSNGTPVSNVMNPQGWGNPDIEVIRDSVMPPVGSTDRSLQFDTYSGGGPKNEDWIGYVYDTPVLLSAMTFQEGIEYPQGGWFKDIRVQALTGGVWREVTDQASEPAYRGKNGVSYETYEFSFDPVLCEGIRLIGQPGGGSHFTSTGELRVFEEQQSEPTEGLPVDYVLGQNFPNPFNPSTAIRFSAPQTGHVTLAIYNMLGQKVRTLVDEVVEPGTQTIVWDGKDSKGITMPSGTYIYRMIAGSFVESHKMLLVK